ncbi:hypothetical protein [Flavobacterium sp.]
MKTKILILALLSLWTLTVTSVYAQDRTTVTANNSDISDNLDLRAVASIFGDSNNLEDFERRLNDPNAQISNLDLNGDNQVDYLRVIESVEGNAHLIVIQSVLGRDTFQDIATVEVERDRNNRVQVQVVGDVYMYGNNYIYEPVYAYTPVIYNTFWVRNYRPYWSSWYWGYYPSFYIAWSPFPVDTYHSHIGIYINHHHHYNYVNYRRCGVAYNNYYNGRRGNAYERQYPNRSFAQRNTGFSNRRELVNTRKPQISNTRNAVASSNTRNNTSTASLPRPSRVFNGSNEIKNTTPRNQGTRTTESPRSVTFQNGSEVSSPRSNGSSPRGNGGTRNYESPKSTSVETTQAPRSYDNSSSSPRGNGNTRTYESPKNTRNQTAQAPRSFENTNSMPRNNGNIRTETPRSIQRSESTRSSAGQRDYSQQRGNSQRSEGGSRGGGNRRS